MSGGFWGAGAGISVGGRHIANWLIGQVRDETQTEEQVRAYAREIGVDEDEAVEAFREVPVMSRAQFEKVSKALYTLAKQISSSAYQNVLQARFIAERKKAEDALFEKHAQLQATVRELKQTRNMLRLVIEAIPVRVFWKDVNSRYLGGNSLFARDAGLDHPNELLGKDDFDLKWVEHADRHRAEDREIMETGISRVNIVSPLSSPAGETIWVNTSKVPLRLPSGEVFGVLGVYEDITERRRTAEALSLRQSYLTAIIENQPGLLWLKDTESRFLSVNQAFVRFCGKQTQEDIIGKTDLDLLPRKRAEQFMEADRALMKGLAPVSHLEYIDDQGTARWFQTFKTPVFTEEGKVLGTCGFALDVTERKLAEEEHRKLEERLQRAEKMEALGTLAGGVAHDLNNVLGIVVGYSELLLHELGNSGPVSSNVSKIMTAGLRAAAIVQDLLTLARRGVQARKAINLNALLVESVKSVEFAKILSFHTNVQIKTDFAEDLLNLSGSSIHLEKTFLNLVYNAAEAMPHGGTLTIRTRKEYLDRPVSGYDEVREGDYALLSVADTGEGISSDDLKRIFEPFYTKKVMGRSGTGLGLAVVWGTVKDHDGYINVESEEGKGTVFTLYFPVTHEEMPPEPASVSTAEYMGNGESILVVDDVKEQREMAAKILMNLNYRVAALPSGEEAVEYLKQHAVDLVVLDMIMDPGMDGLDTYMKMLKIHPRQKAIIVSGFSETERVGKALELGAGTCVKKPYVVETLGLAVRKTLAAPPRTL